MNEHEEPATGDKVVADVDDGAFARRIASRINKALLLDPVATQKALETETEFPRDALHAIGWDHGAPWKITTKATLFELAMSGWNGRFRVNLGYSFENLRAAVAVEALDGYDVAAGLLARHAARNLDRILKHSDESGKRLRELMMATTPVNEALGATSFVVPADQGDYPSISALGLMFGSWDSITVAYYTDAEKIQVLEGLGATAARQHAIDTATGFDVVECGK